jgi:hypothetical protein
MLATFNWIGIYVSVIIVLCSGVLACLMTPVPFPSRRSRNKRLRAMRRRRNRRNRRR